MTAKLSRLRAAMRGTLDSVEQADGSVFWFDPREAYPELFLYGSACLRAEYRGEPPPEPPPEMVRAVLNAKDRAAAAEKLPITGGMFPFEVGPLVDRGDLVHRSFRVGGAAGRARIAPDGHDGSR